MLYYILILLILRFHESSTNYLSQNVENTVSDCDELLNDFSIAVSNFTYCSLIHAKPVTMCQKCADSYLYITETHDQLTKTVVNGTACINNFINLDRLQIVSSLYNNVNDLWIRAKCFECVSFQNGTHRRTKVREDFDKMYAQFYQCTQDYDDHNQINLFCDMCMANYIKLNEFYFSVGDITHGGDGVCMDIIDLMNKTQAYWSKTCCQYRVKNEIIYIITTVFMSAIPMIFYIFVKFFVYVKRPRLLPQNRFAESINTPSTSFNRESM